MYLQYAMIGEVFYAFSYPFAIAHRQDARPAIPLLGSIAALCLNCILDPVLMILVAKTPKQAILLAAFSTIASRGTGVLQFTANDGVCQNSHPASSASFTSILTNMV